MACRQSLYRMSAQNQLAFIYATHDSLCVPSGVTYTESDWKPRAEIRQARSESPYRRTSLVCYASDFDWSLDQNIERSRTKKKNNTGVAALFWYRCADTSLIGSRRSEMTWSLLLLCIFGLCFFFSGIGLSFVNYCNVSICFFHSFLLFHVPCILTILFNNDRTTRSDDWWRDTRISRIYSFLFACRRHTLPFCRSMNCAKGSPSTTISIVCKYGRWRISIDIFFLWNAYIFFVVLVTACAKRLAFKCGFWCRIDNRTATGETLMRALNEYKYDWSAHKIQRVPGRHFRIKLPSFDPGAIHSHPEEYSILKFRPDSSVRQCFRWPFDGEMMATWCWIHWYSVYERISDWLFGVMDLNGHEMFLFNKSLRIDLVISVLCV